MVRYGIPDCQYSVGGSYSPSSQVECQCCCAEYDIDDTVACPSNHLFCIDLKQILPRKLFKLYERLKQRKELREANISNLEFCPRCDFAMIMDVGTGSVPLFRCYNKEEGCGRITCRACKRDNHLPRTCEEVGERRDPAHAVEEAMSEALMRRCPSCQQPCIKDSGCNRMLRPYCKTNFCYCCRENINAVGYNHFYPNSPQEENDPRTTVDALGKCLLFDITSLEDRHDREVEIARELARAQHIEAKVRTSSMTLRSDVQRRQRLAQSSTAGGGLVEAYLLVQQGQTTQCNHTVCPDPICRMHFCYLCRKDITVEQYGHFHRNEEHNPHSAIGANGKCLMWDVLQLEGQHAQEVEVARARATAQAESARRTQPAIARPIAGPSRQPAQQAAALVDPPVPQVRQPQAQPAPARPVVHVERHADPAPRRQLVQPRLNPLPVARPPPDPEPVLRPYPPVRAPAQERNAQAQPRLEAVPRRQPAKVQVQARPRIEEVPRLQAFQTQLRRHDWLPAVPRAALWEDSESDEDTPTEDSEDDEYLPAEEEEEEEAFREVDLIPLREDVENAYEQVRKAWTSLAKSKYNLKYRRSVIRERERDVVKANRRYDDIKAAIWGSRRGQRQGHRDHRDMHALGVEVYRMRDALRRAVRRERDSRPKVGSTNTWTKERLEAYVRETRRLEQLMGDAERSCRW